MAMSNCYAYNDFDPNLSSYFLAYKKNELNENEKSLCNCQFPRKAKQNE